MTEQQINFEIETMEGLITLVEEAKKVGLLKDVSMAQVKHNFQKKQFPIRIPVDTKVVMSICDISIVRKLVSKTVESKIKAALLY